MGWGGYLHWSRDQMAAEAQREARDFRPSVRLAAARRETGAVRLTLPGTTLPFEQARIFARATGYVAERRVDIGTQVHQGDLLLRVAAPDLDAQLAQGTAQLSQYQASLAQANALVARSQANLDLANRTNSRTGALASQGWETKQNADNTQAAFSVNAADLQSVRAGVQVAEANLKAQEATVQRLQQLMSYEYVTAPFDGVITARTVERGDLVSAEANGGTGLFSIQRDDVVRVQTYVPQSSATGLREGLDVRVTLPEMPGHPFASHVARTALTLDPASRTLLVQVDVKNDDHLLQAGSYVNVAFSVPRPEPHVVVPSQAVLFNTGGLHVALVDASGRVHMRPITVYRDFGTSVEVSEGLQGGEQVALSPPVDLKDGQVVKGQGPAEAQ